MAGITLKRGDSLEWAISYSQNDSPIDVSAWSFASQLRKNGKLLATLTFTATDLSVGTFVLSALPAVTETLPIGVIQCDIQATVASKVSSTNTFEIEIVEDVTDA